MKKIIFILVAVFTFSFVNAQEVHFGAKAGLNLASMNSSESEFNDLAGSRTAFHIGGVVDISFSDKFSVQPELLYSSVGSIFDYADARRYSETEFGYVLDYLSIPVMAKYYVADNFSLEAGPYLGFLLSATEDGTLKVGDAVIYEADKIDTKENYKSTDFGMGLGAGYKMENGLSFSLRYNLSLMDINDDPEFNGGAERRSGEVGSSDFTMSNNIIQFSIGFTF